jgi:hypothetical protein
MIFKGNVYYWAVVLMDILLIIHKENVYYNVIQVYSFINRIKHNNVLINVHLDIMVYIKIYLRNIVHLIVRLDGSLIIQHGLVYKHAPLTHHIMLISHLKHVYLNVDNS